MNHFLSSLFLYLLLPIFSFSQNINHYETLVQPGDSCRYIIPTSETATNWMLSNYNDSNWIKAIGGIGYGDSDDNTEISKGAISIFARYEFQVIDRSDILKMILDADYDDGFIAYLNGTEIARANVPAITKWDSQSTNLHEALLPNGGIPDRFEIDNILLKSVLINGRNVLAVQVHNENKSSSDLSSNFFLHAGIESENHHYSKTPDWFGGPISYDAFNLPLMIINTNGQIIPEEPRILAQMKLIYNGIGKLNRPDDIPAEYDGQISIERRGESSSGFPKKSYTIELQKADSSNNNVSLLGLPKENDFVLYGPHSDKTMMRNAITYQLYREMGSWAPRTRYFEMILNGEYNGIYLLTEKIKSDNNRVDINKLTEKDITEIDISGGYIMRRDKTNKLDPTEYWKSPVKQVYFEPLTYQYYYPKYKDLTPAQRQYPKDWMKKFDQMMSGSSFKDKQSGYPKYINIKSFIDMTILNEYTKGIDSYMFSTYFYKENDKNGGKLNAGPPWDYNLSMGNINYGDHHRYTYGWVYDNWSRVYWFKRLMEDPVYKNQVYARWDSLRTNVYSEENINFIVDSTVTYLGDAIQRNFSRFPILGVYVWPNQWFPGTYEEEIVLLKEWLMGRLAWMDGEWANKYDPSVGSFALSNIQSDDVFMVYPTLSDFSSLMLELKGVSESTNIQVKILNSQGKTVYQQSIKAEANKTQIHNLINLSYLSNGLYMMHVSNGEKIYSVQKIIKK